MRRRLLIILTFALVAAACGPGGASPPIESGGVAEAASVIGSTPPTSTPDGVQIPDISLTLADGSTFDLATIDTPVMMIFWAEW